jgi:hypothetical protein
MRIAELMYTVLLRELGYSEDFDIAELEIELEAEGKLAEFIATCKTLLNKDWETVRAGAQKPSRARRMADQRYIAHLLKAHHANQNSSFLPSPKLDALGNLIKKLGSRHVRLVPTVCGNHPSIGFCCLIDDRLYGSDVVICTASYH